MTMSSLGVGGGGGRHVVHSLLATSSSASSSSSLVISTTVAVTATVAAVAIAFLGGLIVGKMNVLSSSSSSSLSKSKGSAGFSTANSDDSAAVDAEVEGHLWKLVQYSFTSSLIRVCDELDLYTKLHEYGRPVSCSQLAQKYDWNERWLLEVLLQSTAAGLCVYNEPSSSSSSNIGTFQLNPKYVKFLLPPQLSKSSYCGTFQLCNALTTTKRLKAVRNAVQYGVGVTYDYGINNGEKSGNNTNGVVVDDENEAIIKNMLEQQQQQQAQNQQEDEDVSAAIDRKNGNFFKYRLLPDIIEKTIIPKTGQNLIDLLDNSSELNTIINVADVGCGCGASTITMAKRFPHCIFYAYEASPRSIQIMKRNILKENISNIVIKDVTQPNSTIGDLPNDFKFQFVYSHDVLHDMTHPKSLIQDIRNKLDPDNGCWFIVDVHCGNTINETLSQSNAATLYGFSCLLCLSSATSETTGEGLGTCGFTPQIAKQWIQNDAGFKHFERRYVKSLPSNACYLVGI